ncbi:MAG: ATP-binding cassette domain-containing protein [SAR324 cluster bacterium]|jgi:ABC-2 type transport system ATP-binding protein|nr:ABC transporter ATP-binding protein [Deltaproteobacteria bacterium]MDP6091061.1 ATP-binding cassette domain-containing protein [SAR324 cluster bacterium]MDP6245829.1 ATP-binding cassette domain-containing protein [SAR324 cluster bacterium]MDP6463490.1 ATP-binding cassette domain-containing protein [SAR324 cluster bacterium]MDP6638163.1 ATP-binding cassette domain-containing protein [SAR324 cluster bacterium]|tara:strand:+ start:2004 stop:2942 length:939 start_codon:yes stop_codon:yes gene_type:complete
MIVVEALSKQFGRFQAVDEISFEVQRGEVLGFLGPNGAGKSTTMKMLTCYLPPTSGNAEVNGFSINSQPLQVQEQIGYLPESAPSYNEMQVEEFLTFIGEVRGFSGTELRRKVGRVLELTSLQDARKQIIDTLSKGFRQRTCLAQSLIHDPPVLILDEPTDGLDPNQKHEVRELIRRMSEERTILISTHILEEVEAVCSRALIISEGRLVGLGTPDELLSQSIYRNAVTLSVSGKSAEALLEDLNGLEQVYSVERLEDMPSGALTVRVFPKDRESISSELEQFLKKKKMVIEQFFVERGRLDEVFRNLTLGN